MSLSSKFCCGPHFILFFLENVDEAITIYVATWTSLFAWGAVKALESLMHPSGSPQSALD